MGRIKRQRLGRGVYHVLNRALDKRWVLEDSACRRKFLEYLVRFSADEEVEVYAWVLMANHYHLAVEVLEPETLSRWIGKTQGRFSLWWHKQHGGSGPLWQARFRTIVVQKDGYLGRLGRYIERNPLRAGIDGLERPWEYQWSSANAYVTGNDDPLVQPSRHPFWSSMGSTDAERRERYGRYLLTDAEAAEDLELFRRDTHVVGDDSFTGQLTRTGGRYTARKVGRPRNPLA